MPASVIAIVLLKKALATFASRYALMETFARQATGDVCLLMPRLGWNDVAAGLE